MVGMGSWYSVFMLNVSYFELSKGIFNCKLSYGDLPDGSNLHTKLSLNFSVPYPQESVFTKDELVNLVVDICLKEIEWALDDEDIEFSEIDYHSCWTLIRAAYERSLKSSMIRIK